MSQKKTKAEQKIDPDLVYLSPEDSSEEREFERLFHPISVPETLSTGWVIMEKGEEVEPIASGVQKSEEENDFGKRVHNEVVRVITKLTEEEHDKWIQFKQLHSSRKEREWNRDKKDRDHKRSQYDRRRR